MFTARLAVFDFNKARRQTLRADDKLSRHANEVHGRKLGPCAIVAIVVEGIKARHLKRCVSALTRAIYGRITGSQIDDADIIRRDRIGPDAWTPEHYAALARFYPEGLPDTDLDAAHDRLVGRSRLRIVGAAD